MTAVTAVEPADPGGSLDGVAWLSPDCDENHHFPQFIAVIDSCRIVARETQTK